MKIFKGSIGVVIITLLSFVIGHTTPLLESKNDFIDLMVFFVSVINVVFLPILLHVKAFREKLKEGETNITWSSVLILTCTLIYIVSPQIMNIINKGHLIFENIEDKSIFYTFLEYYIVVNIIGTLVSYVKLKANLRENIDK